MIEASLYLGYVYLLENKKSELLNAGEKVYLTHPNALEALNYHKS